MEKTIAERVTIVTVGLCNATEHFAGMAEAGGRVVDDLDRLISDPASVPQGEEWAVEWKKTIPEFERMAHELAIAHATMNRFLKRLKKL